jgi:hypothetical protein
MDYCVIVSDNYGERREGRDAVRVTGFTSLETAAEYARRRTRASVEELRSPGATTGDVRSGFLRFGESSAVVCGEDVLYEARSDLDFFAAHPAVDEDLDWLSLEPAPPRAIASNATPTSLPGTKR